MATGTQATLCGVRGTEHFSVRQDRQTQHFSKPVDLHFRTAPLQNLYRSFTHRLLCGVIPVKLPFSLVTHATHGPTGRHLNVPPRKTSSLSKAQVRTTMRAVSNPSAHLCVTQAHCRSKHKLLNRACLHLHGSRAGLCFIPVAEQPQTTTRCKKRNLLRAVAALAAGGRDRQQLPNTVCM